MTSILSSAYNMLPNMPTWIGGGGASTAVSKPAPTKPRRGWWGRGGTTATDKTTTKTDAVQEKVITRSPTDRTAANTTKATTRKDVSSPVGTAPTIPPTGKSESGTEPGDTTVARPAASTRWFSRAPKSPPLFRDDRRWISAWPLTSHKAVNKDFSWKGLTSDQVGELYDLHSRYYGAKKPDNWEFASEASKYLHDTEQAIKFYRETVFAGGRVPKELTTLPSGHYEVAQRLVDAARDIGTDATKRWANDTQTWINHYDIETLKGQVSAKTVPSVADTTSPQFKKLQEEVTNLHTDNEKLVNMVRALMDILTTIGKSSPTEATAPGQTTKPSIRFTFGQEDGDGTAGTMAGTAPTMKGAETATTYALITLPTDGDLTA